MQGIGQRPLAVISDWLARTSLSHLLQDVDWLVPAIQTVHILCVALVISSVLMVALGVFGLHGREQPLARTMARFAPGLYWGLPVLLISGALMIAAEPDRALPNPVFQLKMALLLAAVALTFVNARRVRQAAAAGAPRTPGLRLVTAAALGLWIAVLVAGRWIAYALSH
jgi:hypothetical protein